MTKSRPSLLMAVVIAIILIAGCTTQNQTSQASNQTVSTNASTSLTSRSTTAAVSSSVASASATPATPTPAPSASGKIATSIALGIGSSGPPQLDFTKGESISWVIDVTSSTGLVHGGGVTVSIPGTSAGQVTYESPFHSAYFTLNGGLPAGTHKVTLHYVGDSTHQPSETTFNINVT